MPLLLPENFTAILEFIQLSIHIYTHFYGQFKCLGYQELYGKGNIFLCSVYNLIILNL